MKKQAPAKEVIQPVFPTDFPIVKEVKEDGTVVFSHPAGPEVETWEEPLDTILSLQMDRFRTLIELLDDDDRDRFGFLFNVLIDHAESQLHEIFHFLDQSVGKIECTLIMKNWHSYRTDRVVCVTLRPPEERRAES